MSQLDKYINKMRGQGLKLTGAREQMIEALLAVRSPFLAETVIGELKKRGFEVHKATVYRDLNMFVSKGLLRELVFRGSKAHYFDFVGEQDKCYFRCRECGLVSSVGVKGVGRIAERVFGLFRSRGYKLESFGLKFYGVCGKCRRGK